SVPYVLVYNRHPAHPCVSVAGDLAMQEVVHELASLGHRNIRMVSGRLESSDRAQQRHAGFTAAMRAKGLPLQAVIEVPFLETATREIAQSLDEANRPTALVCSNDVIAVRAIRAAHECGLSVPADLSVTGFDGISLSQE